MLLVILMKVILRSFNTISKKGEIGCKRGEERGKGRNFRIYFEKRKERKKSTASG